jgi:thioredoxin
MKRPNNRKHGKMIRSVYIVLAALILTTSVLGFAQGINSKPSKRAVVEQKPLVTFVELGSVRCIPCRQMQPVMKAIEEEYGSEVKVVFHDVWTETGRPAAEQYHIRLIPTQVFLDKSGKEFFRHEGFFPEAEIHKLLQKRGLKRSKAGS